MQERALLLDQIKRDLKSQLSTYRYSHIESVVKQAQDLTTRFLNEAEVSCSEDELRSRVELAAYLHDYAKELTNSEQISLAKYYGIEIYPEDEDCPNLLHARNAAAIAEDKYEVLDPRILNAIREHTFGAGEMCLESRIVYLADFLSHLPLDSWVLAASPDASSADLQEPSIAICSSILASNWERAILITMNTKIQEVLRKGQSLHPLGVMARNDFLRGLPNSASLSQPPKH